MKSTHYSFFQFSFILLAVLVLSTGSFGQGVFPTDPVKEKEEPIEVLYPLDQEGQEALYRTVGPVKAWTEEAQKIFLNQCNDGQIPAPEGKKVDCPCLLKKISPAIDYAKYQSNNSHHKSRITEIFGKAECLE